MKITQILLTAAALLPSALAGTVSVFNNCAFKVFMQPNGGAPVTVAPGKKHSHTLTGPGSYVRMSTARSASNALTLEYTPSGNTLYYDLSNNAGNPFSSFRNTLKTSRAGCQGFNCGPNAVGCYSNAGAVRVFNCQSPTNLIATLCA